MATKEYMRKWRARPGNTEKNRAIARRYYHQHQERVKRSVRSWRKRNKKKHQENNHKWYLKNRAAVIRRSMTYYRRYQELRRLIAKGQHGLCAICAQPLGGRSGTTHGYLDHDHESKRVRGCLCNRCNIGLGAFSTIDLLEKAKTYVLAPPLPYRYTSYARYQAC